MGVEPVIDISKVNEERDREKGVEKQVGGRGGGGRGTGDGDGVIEVARKREARLAEGKGSEEERDGREGGGELQRQREKLMSRVCQPLTSIIYVQAGDARGRGPGALVCSAHGTYTTLLQPCL